MQSYCPKIMIPTVHLHLQCLCLLRHFPTQKSHHRTYIEQNIHKYKHTRQTSAIYQNHSLDVLYKYCGTEQNYTCISAIKTTFPHTF